MVALKTKSRILMKTKAIKRVINALSVMLHCVIIFLLTVMYPNMDAHRQT